MNAYEIITDQIIADIETGKASGTEWVMPWHSKAAAGMPISLSTGKAYNGVNIISLWASAYRQGFESSLWGTFKQWRAKGANVKRGEKGTKIVFWKQLEISDTGSDESRVIPMAKAYTVFNADQVDGYQVDAEPVADPQGADALADIDALIGATGANIEHVGNQACYIPTMDQIRMPKRESFIDTANSTATENYYSTMFHELAHWTGAAHRLDRTKGKRFGDTAYAFEELVAELSAAFTCAFTGVTSSPRADHAQYIANWLGALKSDKRFIFDAAKYASKATQWIVDPTERTAASKAA